MLLSAQQVEVHVHQDNEANVIGADEIMCLWLKEKCENEVYLTVCQDEWNKHKKNGEQKCMCVVNETEKTSFHYYFTEWHWSDCIIDTVMLYMYVV